MALPSGPITAPFLPHHPPLVKGGRRPPRKALTGMKWACEVMVPVAVWNPQNPQLFHCLRWRCWHQWLWLPLGTRDGGKAFLWGLRRPLWPQTASSNLLSGFRDSLRMPAPPHWNFIPRLLRGLGKGVGAPAKRHSGEAEGQSPVLGDGHSLQHHPKGQATTGDLVCSVIVYWSLALHLSYQGKFTYTTAGKNM